MIKCETLERIIQQDVYLNVCELYLRLEELQEINIDDWENLYSTEDDYPEIYEYWLVSEWLFKQLQIIGAPVREYAGLYFWGRTETGQCLTMDYHLNRV